MVLLPRACARSLSGHAHIIAPYVYLCSLVWFLIDHSAVYTCMALFNDSRQSIKAPLIQHSDGDPDSKDINKNGEPVGAFVDPIVKPQEHNAELFSAGLVKDDQSDIASINGRLNLA